VPIGFLVPGPNGETETESRRYNWVWYRTAVGPTARDEVLTDLEDRLHPYSLPPGGVSGRARERLVDDANRLLPRSFAAAVEATARPFVQGISDYEQRSPRRIALVGDAAFVVRPHTGMGIAKAAADAIALRKHLSSAPLGDALRGYRQERVQAGTAIAASGRELGAHVETANLGEADELACRP
jgi:2-polyprenyl-6-methoxyphenol hydroxylase-like FAD-dependent oxidoreductase